MLKIWQSVNFLTFFEARKDDENALRFRLMGVCFKQHSVAQGAGLDDGGAVKRLLRRPALNTIFLLMAQYGGRSLISVDDVCKDYFSHLTPAKLVRKIDSGEIPLALVRIEQSQKAARGVHIADLASYIDARRDAARRELAAMRS